MIGHQRRNQRIAETIDTGALPIHHLRTTRTRSIDQGKGIPNIRTERDTTTVGNHGPL
ncbi:hypothetical protein D3C81_1929200 [compost metagenome]